MKKFKQLVIRSLVAIALTISWSAAPALEKFERSGVIDSRDFGSFKLVAGEKYRISPGATLRSNAGSRSKFTDFRSGDFIVFRGKILNGVNYVDMIIYETPEPS